MMLLARESDSSPFQMTLLTPSLAKTHQCLETTEANSAKDESGLLRFDIAAELLFPNDTSSHFLHLVYSASTANRGSHYQSLGPNVFNQSFVFSLFGRHAQHLQTEAISSDLPKQAPTGMLLMDLLSQQQLGRGSADYQAVFGRYTQQIQQEAAAVVASLPGTAKDPRYIQVLALAEHLQNDKIKDLATSRQADWQQLINRKPAAVELFQRQLLHLVEADGLGALQVKLLQKDNSGKNIVHQLCQAGMSAHLEVIFTALQQANATDSSKRETAQALLTAKTTGARLYRQRALSPLAMAQKLAPELGQPMIDLITSTARQYAIRLD